MKYEGLIFEKKDGIAVVTLNRPERSNSLTVTLGRIILPNLFREIQADDEVHVLIITGAGKVFCAGADIDEVEIIPELVSKLGRSDRLKPIGAMALQLYNLEKPVIVALNGIAAGAGASIALVADIRIASENAGFSMSFVSRGLIPDSGATFFLPRLIGTAKAFELLCTGERIDAKTAERIGMVNKVVPHNSLMDEAMSIAKKLVEAPPLAIAQIKRALHLGIINDLEQQLYFETYAQNFCAETEDAREGVASFVEKRRPQFKGR